MKKVNVADCIRYQRMSTEELREHYLLSLFTPGSLELVYTDVDRAIVGSALPLHKPLLLEGRTDLRADFFLERRELGILNIGGAGTVTVDGRAYSLSSCDGLYVGRGSRDISFASDNPSEPAAFYLLSYPAHTTYPTCQIKKNEAEASKLGDVANCNRRTLYKYIHPRGVPSCQLVMGFTELEEGSVWNTMPSHTHARRSEIYLYFKVRPEVRIVHLMGLPEETRHLIVADRQAVLSPAWSIHSGVGNANYSFCWGMGGENQTFEDMDPVPVESLR